MDHPEYKIEHEIGFKIMHLQERVMTVMSTVFQQISLINLSKRVWIICNYDGIPTRVPYGKYLLNGFEFDLFICSSPVVAQV
ncbi:MAG: hypothetical protein IPN39_13420 [Chitinophagaceae bacterium]|nr:hypothetical protein [Chitinophagaceae bacterium]